MDYKESLDWLYSQLPMFSRVGAAAYKPGLQTSEALDEYFGHPHRKFRSIHVAGTNGKGSVSHSLAAVLQSQGYRTGLYTSPHLIDFRERIRVDGEMIPEAEVTDFVNRFRQSGYAGSPSFFELTMMMAFDWFARSGVDYAVIEVGMGGRLDSTNIITPEACVITNISPDHMQFLGDTLEKIAAEKAGIIKHGIPVTIGEASGTVRDVFANRALEVGAPIRFAEIDEAEAKIERNAASLWHTSHSSLGEITYSLTGDYQRANLRTVLASLRMLREAGIGIEAEAVRRGLADVQRLTGLQGRWMTVNDRPLTICDTGHNEAGFRYNMAQLGSLLAQRPGARLRMVIGFVSDKDVDHILHLLPQDADYMFTQASVPRAMPCDELASKCREAGLQGESCPSVKEAVRLAMTKASGQDIVYIGGSTFVVADFLASR